MEKQLFGEYLVEKGMITEENLAETLIKQIKALPSIAELLFEKKLLKTRELLDILKYQAQKRVGMIEAAKALGIWTGDLDREFQTYLSQSKIPIAALLIEQGLVTLDQITSAFDEFLSTQNLTQEAPKETTTSPPQEQIPPNSLQLADVLTPDLKDTLTLFSEKLSAQTISTSELQKIRDKIRPIHSSVQQSSLDTFKTLTGAFEETLEGWLKKGAAPLNSDLVSRMKIVTEGYISLLWELRDQVASGRNENDFLSDSAHKKKFETILGTAQVLNFDIDTNLLGVKA